MAKLQFTNRTFNLTKQGIKRDILQAMESSTEMRAEIRRVFQMANRRIQNVEQSGLLSPAVSALNKGEIKGYTKFSMRNNWTDLKTEYAKAISFLRQPTSTLTGLSEYNNHLKKEYDLSDDEFNLMSKNINNKLGSISDSNFVERYLMRYKDFTGELETEARDISDQLEDDAILLQRAINDAVEKQADGIIKGQSRVEAEIKRINDNFNKFS